VSAPLVAAEAVSVVYGRGATAAAALREVSLEVRRGEILLIHGPSGSGKTTLLQVLGALLQPSSGRVLVNGRAIGDLSATALGRLRRDFFGFIFQACNLIPTLNAWENVAIAFDLKGRRDRHCEEESRALLDEVGLAHRSEAYPAQLSGGQKQRVAVARALAFDPAVILADEPTAALDSAAGWQVIQLLTDLAARRDRAVVIVTHDTRLLAAGDRAVALEDGRIVGELATTAA
jgi:putative ABC transport system ATP-binding protein